MRVLQSVLPQRAIPPVTLLVYILAKIPLSFLPELAPPLLFSPQDQFTPLHHAAMNGNEAACRVLMEAGAKVDAEDEVSWNCMKFNAV